MLQSGSKSEVSVLGFSEGIDGRGKENIGKSSALQW